MAEENFREAFSLFPACQKLLPHLYPSIRGDLQGDLRMICVLFTKFESPDIRLNGSEKNSPHLYPKIQGFVGVVERMIYGLFTKFESPDIRLNGSEKTLLTYMKIYRGLRGCFEG